MKCTECGRSAECRPYGENDALICFFCAMSTPQRMRRVEESLSAHLKQGDAVIDDSGIRRPTWLEIADYIEKATGTPQELTEIAQRIMRKLGYAPQSGSWWKSDGGEWFSKGNRIAVSIDAITALIERKLPGWMVRVQWCSVSAEAWVAPDLNSPLCDPAIRADEGRWHDYSERSEVEIRPGSRDAAIRALCAAFARAMHERGE